MIHVKLNEALQGVYLRPSSQRRISWGVDQHPFRCHLLTDKHVWEWHTSCSKTSSLNWSMEQQRGRLSSRSWQIFTWRVSREVHSYQRRWHPLCGVDTWTTRSFLGHTAQINLRNSMPTWTNNTHKSSSQKRRRTTIKSISWYPGEWKIQNGSIQEAYPHGEIHPFCVISPPTSEIWNNLMSDRASEEDLPGW